MSFAVEALEERNEKLNESNSFTRRPSFGGRNVCAALRA